MYASKFPTERSPVAKCVMIAEANTDAPKSFCDAPDGTAALRFSVNHKQTKIKTTNNKQIFKPPAWANFERR